MKEPGRRRGPKTECHGLDRGRADTWGLRNYGQSREETVSDSPGERVLRGETDADRSGSLKATQSPADLGKWSHRGLEQEESGQRVERQQRQPHGLGSGRGSQGDGIWEEQVATKEQGWRRG